MASKIKVANPVVELDGDSHAERFTYDTTRTYWLETNGYRVLRFLNAEVHQKLEGVVEAILAACTEQGPPSPRPLSL